MAAYAIVELEITNMEGMAPYMEAVPDTVAAHGGKYLVRAGETESCGRRAWRVSP